MNVWQVWLVAGIPSLVLALLCFVRRSPVAALLGYVFLAVGFAIVVTVDHVSAALFGGLLALLYAAGRGGRMEGRSETTDVIPDVAKDEGHGHVGTP